MGLAICKRIHSIQIFHRLLAILHTLQRELSPAPLQSALEQEKIVVILFSNQNRPRIHTVIEFQFNFFLNGNAGGMP
jgi:hypothetical protein